MRKSIAGGLTILGMTLVALGTHYDGQRAADAASRPALGGIHPRISPDGKSIAFSWQGAIWRMQCATAGDRPGTMTRLTSGTEFDVEPAWSPDGKQIAFVRSPNMGEGELRLIDAERGTELPLPAPVHWP
jgi:Tol biopolymer transport system component